MNWHCEIIIPVMPDQKMKNSPN